MKTSSFFALVKSDLDMVKPFLLLPLFFAYLSINTSDQKELYGLTLPGVDAFFVIIPLITFIFLFQSGGLQYKATNAPAAGNLEFIFSRAIKRNSIFASKSGLYLILSLIAPLIILVYSFASPLIRIELPSYNYPNKEAAKQFYKSHFKDSYLQEPDQKNDKEYIVLPQGHLNQAVCTFLITFAGTLLIQAGFFAFSKWPWISLIIYFAMMIGIPFVSFSGIWIKFPSLYELTLVWITQHMFLAFIGLGVLFVLAQRYCCARFVYTEII